MQKWLWRKLSLIFITLYNLHGYYLMNTRQLGNWSSWFLSKWLALRTLNHSYVVLIIIGKYVVEIQQSENKLDWKNLNQNTSASEHKVALQKTRCFGFLFVCCCWSVGVDRVFSKVTWSLLYSHSFISYDDTNLCLACTFKINFTWSYSYTLITHTCRNFQ